MSNIQNFLLIGTGMLCSLIAPLSANADAVTDWSIRACEIADPRISTPTSNRVLAIMHTTSFRPRGSLYSTETDRNFY